MVRLRPCEARQRITLDGPEHRVPVRVVALAHVQERRRLKRPAGAGSFQRSSPRTGAIAQSSTTVGDDEPIADDGDAVQAAHLAKSVVGKDVWRATQIAQGAAQESCMSGSSEAVG